ncbi:MAG: hypothetical protein LBI85_00605 [Spirochaetaceae bacterium]|jgi:hypothetical protein|nr:hypothetical protein [Spirochaetaceae bacterium]
MGDIGQSPSRGLSFEDVWAMFQETDRKMDKMARETAQIMRETDQKMQETARQMKETDRKIWALGNRFV